LLIQGVNAASAAAAAIAHAGEQGRTLVP
jgi:hypothetical protein